MFRQCSRKFWLENPTNLFCSPNLIPSQHMSNETQFNAITRLVLIVSIVLYALNYKYTSIFLLLSLMIIICGYYFTKNRENFTPYNKSMSYQQLLNYKPNLPPVTTITQYSTPSVQDTPYQDESFFQEIRESGPPLPRTLVKPIIVNPPYMNMPDGYNDPTTDNVIQRKIEFKNLTEYCQPVKENFELERNELRPNYPNARVGTTYNEDSHSFSVLDNENPYYLNNNYIQGNDKMGVKEAPFACGYNVDKIKYGIPVNFPATPMELNDKMTDYNKKIFTNRYGSVLYHNDVQEPNFIQNLQSTHYYHGPVSRDFNPKNGESIVTRHDPYSYKLPPTKLDNPFDERPSLSNMFDGRTVGYGQEYRAYIDPVASNVNYMYDDIDTGVRGYNFISRNKVDIYPEAEQTGILGEDGPNANIHQIAMQGFIDKTNQFRNDMIDGYIREFDPIEAQRKLYPVQNYYGRR